MVNAFLTYLTSEKRSSKHTVSAYSKDLEQFTSFLHSSFEIEEPVDAQPVHLRDWIVALTDQGMSPKSVNRKIATLRSYYTFLLAREYLDVDPSRQIKLLKSDKKLPSFLKENEMDHLLDQVEFTDDFTGQRDRMLVELLYATGIRLAELQGLKEADINFYENTIRVLGKGNKERIIPVGNSSLSLVKVYIKHKRNEGMSNDYLLVTNAGNQLYPMFIYRKVKYLLGKVTTLSKKSPHVLRHTFATHLLNKGADLNAIKDLLGHTSLAATQVYTHNSIEKLKMAFDQAHPKA